ncbi:MAG: hypothetical protein QXQ33_03780 [Nitrososphaerota archaeon]
MTRQSRSNSRLGLSTAIGIAIVLAIVFTVILPLFMYQASLNSLLSSEINSRMIRDIDRATENLRVLIESDQDGISVILKNVSPLLINVVRVWAIDANTGSPIGAGPCIDQSYYVPIGNNVTVSVTTCVGTFTGTAQFIAVTERGRLFASDTIKLVGGKPEPGLFPYTLTISVVNMARGNVYQIEVVPMSKDANIDPRSIAYKATASNENISLAFSSTAGSFSIALYENGKLVSKGRLVSPDSNPKVITIPDVTSVVFKLRRQVIIVETLDVEIVAPSQVIEESSFSFSITVKLPITADEEVELDLDKLKDLVRLSGDGSLTGCSEGSGRLSPGQTITALTCFVVASSLPGNQQGSITITVVSSTSLGEGRDSGLSYPSDSDSVRVSVKAQKGKQGGGGPG